jgi:hypothetical protein
VMNCATTEATSVMNRSAAETTAMVHASAESAVMHSTAHMTTAHMTATHVAPAHMAASTASVSVKCWQIRTQTQKEGRCQYSRHSAHPGMHRCSRLFYW